MKTKPMAHQVVGSSLLASHPDFYALGCEQGTGKTWMLLEDAERRYNSQEISGVLVIAPKGVHINWTYREVPKHVSVPYIAAHWKSGAGKKHMRALDKLLTYDGGALVIFAMNVDAVNTKGGLEYAQKFLSSRPCIFIVDESQRIKNPQAKRTKRILELADLAYSRRISSGTLVSNSPLDLFSQFGFLQSGLLGTESYRAFVSEYAELLPPGHPLMDNIAKQTRRGTPQIIKHDKSGRPMYKNLEKLNKMIAPHMYRVRKEECLDLPEKIYQTHYFDMVPEQAMVYEQVKNEMRYEREDGDIDMFTALTLINKLRQITSGFILVDGAPAEWKNGAARMAALKEILEDAEYPVIIWATFREELRQIAQEAGGVSYHGGIGPKEREEAIEKFQSGESKVFVANAATAGTGLTLTAAKTVIYYSCSYSLEERIQSEDRAHRIGTHHPVVYVDLVASGTIDERIADSLQSKAGVAAKILGDELI